MLQGTDCNEIKSELCLVLKAVIANFDPSKGKFETYFRPSAIHKFKRLKKKKATHNPLSGSGSDTFEYVPDTRSESSPMENSQRHEMVDELKQCINELPFKHRTAVILVKFEGMSYEEAAQQMNCPVGSVKGWVNRAIQQIGESPRLRELMG